VQFVKTSICRAFRFQTQTGQFTKNNGQFRK
jgi:hypothetical protein